jgi:hypothetical protein
VRPCEWLMRSSVELPALQSLGELQALLDSRPRLASEIKTRFDRSSAVGALMGTPQVGRCKKP